MRKVSAFLAFLLLATSAAASDWRNVGKNSANSEYWIDASTVMRSGDDVRVWVKTIYGSANSNGTTSYKAHREIQCGDRSYRDLETVYFKGEDVSSNSGLEDWRNPSPDSIAEAVVKAACAL